MQKWEYLEISRLGNSFAVFGSKGAYFTAEYYKLLDPKAVYERGRDMWRIENDESSLLTILDELGKQGWELTGVMGSESTSFARLLLKRVVAEG